MGRIFFALASAFLIVPSAALLARPGAARPPESAGRAASTASPSKNAPVPGDDDPDPPISRTVIHTQAYKQRAGLGPHVNFKVTPPEKVGRKRRVLVEIYNYSTVYLNVVDFYLQLYSVYGERVEVHIVADDIKPSWSGLKWVRIKGDKRIPKIIRVEVQDLQIFNDKGRKVALKAYTDLIKE